MPKLTGYKEVAVIEIAGKDYHFAIYDDGQNYSAGDMVIVSGAARTDIREIKEIISIEAAETRCAKGITAEVISRVDLLDYRKRVEYRRAEAKLRNEINKAVSKVDKETKLRLYAENLPEIKALLDKYKELTGGELMIWVTGDIHGDPRRLSSRSFDEQEFFEKQDENFLIILGDFGLVWNREKENSHEKWWIDWLENKPFTTLFIDGNHENHDRLDKYPVSEWNGGKVHFIRPHVIHLMRGQVFNIQGKTFFTFGGAASHDIRDGILKMSDERIFYWNLLGKEYRINHLTWWEREMASREEMNEGLHNLDKVGNKVDFILTHCINTSTAALMSSGRYKPDSMTEYLEKIYGTVEWKKWLFGHYHDNRAMTNNQLLLYEQIIQIA